jgi:hypothetical protein
MKNFFILSTLFVAFLILLPFSFVRSADNGTLSELPGWPVASSGSCAPAVGDIDGDGNLEVVAKNRAWHIDGTPVSGWPVDADVVSGSSPALGDIDGDGILDVVLSTYGISVFRGDGRACYGWPTHYFPQHVSSPALGDIDNDRELEVIAGATGDDNHPDLRFRAYAFNADGSSVLGWPIFISAPNIGSPIFSTAALADINDSGSQEIFVSSWFLANRLFAWHGDGTNVSGWPQWIGSWGAESSPAIGDLDGDGKPEICLGCMDGYFRVWRIDGSMVPGWPQWEGEIYSGYSSPALGDIDNDGLLEIAHVSRDGNYFNIWRWDGTALPGWPKSNVGQGYGEPSIADIDGDGDLEVLFCGLFYIQGQPELRVFAWHKDGTDVQGFPIKLNETGSHVGITVTDLDADGGTEIVVATNELVHAWKMPGVFNPSGLAWPTFHHDMARSGAYSIPEITATIDIKPGSVDNPINPKSAGKIPVAILTTTDLNATSVDPASILFGKTGTETPPVHFALEDVDNDGDNDMILQFKTPSTGIKCGDVQAVLTGKTFRGQRLRGVDSIRTVGCK